MANRSQEMGKGQKSKINAKQFLFSAWAPPRDHFNLVAFKSNRFWGFPLRGNKTFPPETRERADLNTASRKQAAGIRGLRNSDAKYSQVTGLLRPAAQKEPQAGPPSEPTQDNWSIILDPLIYGWTAITRAGRRNDRMRGHDSFNLLKKNKSGKTGGVGSKGVSDSRFPTK